MILKTRCLVDILRRAKVDVTVVGVDIPNVWATCSRGVKICADVKLQDIEIKAVKDLL